MATPHSINGPLSRNRDPEALRHQRKVAEDHVVMVNTIQVSRASGVILEGVRVVGIRLGVWDHVVVVDTGQVSLGQRGCGCGCG